MNKTKKWAGMLVALLCAFVLSLSLGVFCACSSGGTAETAENAKSGTWYYGASAPQEDFGKEGDYYLNTSNLASYVKAGEEWKSVDVNWYYGTEAPQDTIGQANDFYLNTDSGALYQKTEGGWGEPVLTLKGEKGRDGVIWFSGAKDPEKDDPTLTDARKGDFYLNTSDFTVWQLVENEGKTLEWTPLGSIAGKGFQGFETKGNQLIVTFTDGTEESFAFASCLGEHTFGDAEPMTIIEAGCTNRGLVLKTCTVCGTTVAEGVEAKGHQFVDGVCTSCGKNQLEGHYETNEEGKCEVTISPDLVEEGGDLTIASAIDDEEVTVKEAISDADLNNNSKFKAWTQEINNPDTNPNENLHIGTLVIQEGVDIGNGAFAGATIEHLVLEGNASYGAYAFTLVKGLQDVTIKGETTLNDYVFNGAELTSVDMSEATIEKIPKGAFYGCTNLENVKLPETLKEIGHVVFEDCKALKVLVLPKTLERVYNMAFYYCSKLEKLVFQSVIKKENRGMNPPGLAPKDKLDLQGCASSMQICFTGTKEEWTKEEPQDTNGMQDMILSGSSRKYSYSYEIAPEDLGNA